MPYYFFIWTPEILEHLAEHGVTEEEFEEVVSDPELEDFSRSTGNPIALGTTQAGRRLCCVFKRIDEDCIEPVTATKTKSEMELTPEQQIEIQQAKAAGQRRVSLQWTDEQRERWRAAVAEETVGKEENLAHLQKIKRALEQPGFFGDVRRAIAMSSCPMAKLAEQLGVDVLVFSDFRAGDAELPPAVLDRLIEVLGLRLMQEIPR